MMYKFFMILLATCTLGIISFTTGNPKQIICFGDSITHGAQVNGHSWVRFLQQQHHQELTFINEGRNGRKTSDKAELLPVLQQYPHAAYYLIFLGVNDLKNGNESMVNDCVQNMKWMVEKIRATDPAANIVILAPSDINLKTMSQINVQKKYNENTKKALVALEKAYDNLAHKEHLGFISLLHVVSKSNYADGLHPNLAGQQQIAAAVWEGLQQYLK